MSNVKLAGNVSGTGSVTIASPNTNSDISISLPTVTGGSFIVSDSSGNVGIGTSSPSTKFTVSGNANLTGNFYTPDYGYIGNSAGTFSGINTGFQTLSGGSGYLLAFTNGNERMRIDSSGNVGIGASSTNRLSLTYDGGTGAATIGPNSTGGSTYLTLGTSNAGTYAERARIDSSGNFQFNSGYGSVATAYGCRAWVNFNGTGTVAIRASGNVSSITDNGTGDYTVNFTTAMPDANYAVQGFATSNDTSAGHQWGFVTSRQASEQLAGSVRITSSVTYTATATDLPLVCASIFR